MTLLKKKKKNNYILNKLKPFLIPECQIKNGFFIQDIAPIFVFS
ncbi:hypothetical protein PHEL49_2351 [Polaribacter sp. Hel1_33_49]|nr:hypothetical protein PHEL49_2351 [Polaribacter sp. Hel1_33_49]